MIIAVGFWRFDIFSTPYPASQSRTLDGVLVRLAPRISAISGCGRRHPCSTPSRANHSWLSLCRRWLHHSPACLFTHQLCLRRRALCAADTRRLTPAIKQRLLKDATWLYGSAGAVTANRMRGVFALVLPHRGRLTLALWLRACTAGILYPRKPVFSRQRLLRGEFNNKMLTLASILRPVTSVRSRLKVAPAHNGSTLRALSKKKNVRPGLSNTTLRGIPSPSAPFIRRGQPARAVSHCQPTIVPDWIRSYGDDTVTALRLVKGTASTWRGYATWIPADFSSAVQNSYDTEKARILFTITTNNIAANNLPTNIPPGNSRPANSLLPNSPPANSPPANSPPANSPSANSLLPDRPLANS